MKAFLLSEVELVIYKMNFHFVGAVGYIGYY